jgi:uncharacterized repeat protein (TIGR03803 family)
MPRQNRVDGWPRPIAHQGQRSAPLALGEAAEDTIRSIESTFCASLYVFTGGSDGLFSFSNLVFDKHGDLYGTTNRGGANGSGVVFRIKP